MKSEVDLRSNNKDLGGTWFKHDDFDWFQSRQQIGGFKQTDWKSQAKNGGQDIQGDNVSDDNLLVVPAKKLSGTMLDFQNFAAQGVFECARMVQDQEVSS